METSIFLEFQQNYLYKRPLATYYIHNSNLSIKKLDVEISEFRYWINKNKLILKSNDNLIKSKNNIKYELFVN